MKALLWQTRPASVEPTMLGVYTSLLRRSTRPSRRRRRTGWRLGHREVGLDVSRLSENCVSIVHDVRSFGEQGVQTFRLICFVSI